MKLWGSAARLSDLADECQALCTRRPMVTFYFKDRAVGARVPRSVKQVARLYSRLQRAFGLQGDVIISAFVVDAFRGGPLCPFRLVAMLRGGEDCALVTVPALMLTRLSGGPLQAADLPLPPRRMSAAHVRSHSVSWSTLVGGGTSGDERAASRAEAIKMVAALEASGFCYITIPAAEANKVAVAMRAAKRWFALPDAVKRASRLECGAGKFVGASLSRKREFFQVRKLPRGTRFPWPHADSAPASCPAAISAGGSRGAGDGGKVRDAGVTVSATDFGRGGNAEGVGMEGAEGRGPEGKKAGDEPELLDICDVLTGGMGESASAAEASTRAAEPTSGLCDVWIAGSGEAGVAWAGGGEHGMESHQNGMELHQGFDDGRRRSGEGQRDDRQAEATRAAMDVRSTLAPDPPPARTCTCTRTRTRTRTRSMEEAVGEVYTMLEGMSRDVMEILCEQLALDAAPVLAMLEHGPDAHITSAGEACPAPLATAAAPSATNTEPSPERMTDKDEAAPRLAGGVGADVFRVYRVMTAAHTYMYVCIHASIHTYIHVCDVFRVYRVMTQPHAPASNPKLALRIAGSWPGVASARAPRRVSPAALGCCCCADVLSALCQYLRAKDAPAPGLSDPATGVHADMGLLTLSPAANLPGLVVLASDGSAWFDVETPEEAGPAVSVSAHDSFASSTGASPPPGTGFKCTAQRAVAHCHSPSSSIPLFAASGWFRVEG